MQSCSFTLLRIWNLHLVDSSSYPTSCILHLVDSRLKFIYVLRNIFELQQRCLVTWQFVNQAPNSPRNYLYGRRFKINRYIVIVSISDFDAVSNARFSKDQIVTRFSKVEHPCVIHDQGLCYSSPGSYSGWHWCYRRAENVRFRVWLKLECSVHILLWAIACFKSVNHSVLQ